MIRDTPKTADGAFDFEADWQCEHCGKTVKFGDIYLLLLSLNIVCQECDEKETQHSDLQVPPCLSHRETDTGV